MNHELEHLIRHDGLVSRRRHLELRHQIVSALRRGELVPVLPGIYVAPHQRTDHELLLQVVAAWDADAVVTGAAAAAATFWPTVSVPTIDVVTKRRNAQPGFTFHRRRLPLDHLVYRQGVRLTSPALTAVMLSHTHGGAAIDEALRSRTVRIQDLRQALELMPDRPGNPTRARLLADSRDEPWSAAERLAHLHLRTAGISGWRANVPVALPNATYYIDVAFRKARLALEIDGFAHHSSREAFEGDRARQNQLMLAGWTVLRYTWSMLELHPEVFIGEVSRWLGL